MLDLLCFLAICTVIAVFDYAGLTFVLIIFFLRSLKCRH